MGSLFQDDFATQQQLAADADERERRYDSLEEGIPDTAWEDYVRMGARRAGSGETVPGDIAGRYEAGMDPGASAWAGGVRYDDGGREIDALDRLSSLARGGLTDADRGMMDATSRREGMAARGDREAQLRELEARGMGSSGASLAASLGAGEAAVGRSADANASMMAQAQARAYEALGAYTSAASHRSDRMAGLETGRLNAVDAWNARERERASGVNARNTERRRSDMDSASGARQTQWENRFNTTAARTSTDERDSDRLAAQQNREEDRDAEREAALWEGVGRIGGGALGMGGGGGR